MKMQITETHKRLPDLNVGSFFCKCQMTRAGEPHICASAEPVKPSWLERLFPDRYFSTQVIVVSIVLIAIFVFVYNQWN